MANISQRVQQPDPGPQVTFFELDLSPIGASQVLFFTNTNIDGAPIVWKGNTYTFVDCEADGFEWSGTGPTPQPTIRVTNVNYVFSSLLRDYDDLVGARIVRRRTFRSFIDGVDSGAAEFEFPADVYAVERKVLHSNRLIEWELASAIDQRGVTLPARQVLRDTCTHTYRFFNRDTFQFDYSQATCPYVGANCFDLANNATGQTSDQCSKNLGGCKARFGENGNLPTRAFPGVGRIPV